MNAEQRARSREGRDVSDDYPGYGNARRRRACRLDLAKFCTTYFPDVFYLPFSADHMRVIQKIQTAVREGGLFALAMPRGSGKTAVLLRAALWALLYRHRRFVVLVGATEELAGDGLDVIKRELQFNDRLYRDFRHVCHCVRRLEGNARRCVGQLFHGQRTLIDWSAKRISLPTMPRAALGEPGTVDVSGSVVAATGLMGAMRGLHAMARRKVIRPELVLLDDPQTRESANSPGQCGDRLAVLHGDLLAMGAPTTKISGVAAVTVIRRGDVADSLLDRKAAPRWQGERCKLLYEMPADLKLWERYAELRADGLRAGDGGKAATAFYAPNREAMDAGAAPAWPERHNPDELSGIQHAMNKYIDDPVSFASEFQNEPLVPRGDEMPMPAAAELAARLNGHERGVVPAVAQYLTAAVDLHDDLLYYLVAAWAGDFTGHVVAYGTYPELGRRSFTKRESEGALQQRFPGTGREGAVRAGLDALATSILAREWPGETGTAWKVGCCLIDAGYLPLVVADFVRACPFGAVITPSRGLGITAVRKPMTEYHRKPGEIWGAMWYVAAAEARAVRSVRYDANYWKGFVHARLATAPGDKGALTFYGREPGEHTLFAEHLVSERSVLVTASGRAVVEWYLRPGRSDNHWFDCLTMAAVGASMQGCALPGATPTPARPTRKKYTQADLRRW